MFNIGGMNVEFHVSPEIQKKSEVLEGKIILQAGGERKIKKILIKLDQHVQRNNGSVDILTIGSTEHAVNATLKAGEEKPVEFKLHFNPKDGIGDKIADKFGDLTGKVGGVVGALGKMGTEMHNRERTYTLKVVMEVEGALWKPEESMGIKLV